MKLDVGSGHQKLEGFVGIDRIKFHDTDIQHDLTVFPWPIKDSCCTEIVMNYVWGCIEPKHRIDLMNELWRIIRFDGKLTIKEQHNSTSTAREDPMYYSGASEITWTYFLCSHKRYEVYKPKPWDLIEAYILKNPALHITVKMRKVI